jgi:hypothetical protein
MKIAKDAFKISLVLLNAFTAVMEIINIAEVITSYYGELEYNFSLFLYRLETRPHRPPPYIAGLNAIA